MPVAEYLRKEYAEREAADFINGRLPTPTYPRGVVASGSLEATIKPEAYRRLFGDVLTGYPSSRGDNMAISSPWTCSNGSLTISAVSAGTEDPKALRKRAKAAEKAAKAQRKAIKAEQRAEAQRRDEEAQARAALVDVANYGEDEDARVYAARTILYGSEG